VTNVTASISGADASKFGIVQGPPSTVGGSSYNTISVQFLPGAACVGTGSAGADKPEAVLSLTGTSCGENVRVDVPLFANCNVIGNAGN